MPENNPNNDKFPKDLPTPKRPWWQRLLAISVILFVLIVGFGIAAYLINTKPTAERKRPPKMQTLVTTMEIFPKNVNAVVRGLGRVIPAQEINLQAQVSGIIEYLHPDFTPGGIIKKDDVIARIDDTDYRLNLLHRQNLLARAEADLRLEEGNQAVARQEWSLINEQFEDIDTSSEDLVLRKPQRAKVDADIKVAKTDIERAEVDLERTVIKAPFNAVVREKQVDIGSRVSTQSSIALLTGIDVFWAEMSIPVNKLDRIVLPSKTESGSKVSVFSNGSKPFNGYIVKLMPDLDADGLMARVLIVIQDPMAIKTQKTPLLLGSFIRAEIIGKELENVFQLPRSALLEGNKVLTVTEDETLHIQTVSVAWSDNEHVYRDQGLNTGEKIIISNVPAPVEGMELDTNGGNKRQEITEKAKETSRQ